MRKIPYKIATYNYTRLETILLAFSFLMFFGLSGLVLYFLFDCLWCRQYEKRLDAGKDTLVLDVIFWVVVFLYIFVYICASVLSLLI